jgi:hypothetical protein
MANLATSLADAIQRFEGWTAGSVSQRNNNPGNLRNGPSMIGTDPNGYAIFPDYQSGYNALVNQVQLNINRGLTLDEFFAGKPNVYGGYAQAAHANQPYNYATTVAGWIGIDPTAPLNQIGSGAGAGAAGSLVDVSGDLANTSSPDILSQLEKSAYSVVGIDFSSPTTDAILLAGLATVVWLAMG